MAIKLVVAVTDGDWFQTLSELPELSEVNFWAPSTVNFRALDPGGLFLFKLHAPRNVIVGGGIFAYATTLPLSLAWEAFEEANGARSLGELRLSIAKHRRVDANDQSDFHIGCRILTQPFFFDEPDWINQPGDWSSNIVSYKTYNTGDVTGHALWEAVQDRLSRQSSRQEGVLVAESAARYGEPRLVEPRLGQGAFRVMATDAYGRRCAVTRERTLPALDAAHIRPFVTGGAHTASNGLLLRRDIHSLFDAGYVTVTPTFDFEVSRSIREEFENGRDYYALHGTRIEVPRRRAQRPDHDALTWHNENIFRG